MGIRRIKGTGNQILRSFYNGCRGLRCSRGFCVCVRRGVSNNVSMSSSVLQTKLHPKSYTLKRFFQVEPRSKMPMMLKNKCLAIVRFSRAGRKFDCNRPAPQTTPPSYPNKQCLPKAHKPSRSLQKYSKGMKSNRQSFTTMSNF